MSSPSFLLANESNHALLSSLLEAINAMVEHQYQRKHQGFKSLTQGLISPDNPNLVYAIIRSRKKFQALRDFTLESGQEEIERQNQIRKEGGAELSRQTSIDSLRSPTAACTPSLGNVPEENSAFAIGSEDEDDSEVEDTSPPPRPRSPVQSPLSGGSRGASRSASIASSVDESVPLQLRGMSEKARGKMPVGQSTFSRQNSVTSLAGMSGTPMLGVNEFFTPSVTWVSNLTVLRLPPYLQCTARILAQRAPAPHHTDADSNALPQTRIQPRHSNSPRNHHIHYRARHRPVTGPRAPLRMVHAVTGLVRIPPLGLRLRLRNGCRKGHRRRVEQHQHPAV